MQIRNEFVWATEQYPQNSYSAAVLPFPEEASQTSWITPCMPWNLYRRLPQQPIHAHISYVQPHGPFHTFAQYMDTVNKDRTETRARRMG